MGWPFLIQIGPIVLMLILGFSVGTLVERAHFKRLEKREASLSHILVTDLRTFPAGYTATPCGLVTGEVVIAADYFKTFLAGLRKIVGGELRTYESLLVRARREALVRLLQSAEAMGANHVVNVRFETSSIGSMRRRGAAMVEMYAYGTAVHAPDRAAS